MPVEYSNAFDSLKDAQITLNSLRGKESKSEVYAALRVAFYQMSFAMNTAAKCYEVSHFEKFCAMGGVYDWAHDELSDFQRYTRNCHMLIGVESVENTITSATVFLERAKTYVAKLQAEESLRSDMGIQDLPSKIKEQRYDSQSTPPITAGLFPELQSATKKRFA